MRNAFAKEMSELAGVYPEIVLLSGDMGNRLFNDYKHKYPDRFYNCGVAEANMTSVAAGMALCGLKPVTYSIASFNILRCIEQIKIDVCYHNLPVIIVGVGAGLSYAELGPTHQTCDDIAIMRSMPNMTIVCPADAVEVRLALRAAFELEKPVYLRLGKKNEPVIHPKDPEFEIGKAIPLKKGSDICILGTGNILPVAEDVADQLESEGKSVSLYSYHTVKPLDETLLESIFDRHALVVTMEEHCFQGGSGSAVADWMLENDVVFKKLLRFGCDDHFASSTGGQAQARDLFGLTPGRIKKRILAYYHQKK